MFSFRAEHSLETRITECNKITEKWPGRVPIILEKASTSRLTDLPKNKFLCPSDYSVQQFVTCVRKKMKVPRETALFVFVNGNELIAGETSMLSIHDQKKDDDGFLYILFSDQEAMGNSILR